MLGPAPFVFLHVAGRQIAVPDDDAGAPARRLEFNDEPRIARFRGKFRGAPGLDDPPPLVDPEEDPVDVPVPGNEPAARPRLDDGLPAAGERRVLPAVHPGREDALRLRGDDHLELEGVGHFPTPRFCSLTNADRSFPLSFQLTETGWRGLPRKRWRKRVSASMQRGSSLWVRRCFPRRECAPRSFTSSAARWMRRRKRTPSLATVRRSSKARDWSGRLWRRRCRAARAARSAT